MHRDFAATASLLAEPSRAVMLLRLLDGRALPAGQLAAAANVSPQTASGHLAKLAEAQLIAAEQQGRHRYYRLASTEVADALEAVLVLLPGVRHRREPSTAPQMGTIAYARTCYSHLAGWLGIRVVDALQSKGFLLPGTNRTFVITDAGLAWFLMLGIRIPSRSTHATSRYARQCLDWTERRPHLAGALGVALYRQLLHLKWLAIIPGTRAVRVTLRGQQELWNQLGISLNSSHRQAR